MALIAPTPPHAAAGRFSPVAIDASLAEVVKVTGGIYWLNGAPVVAPGGIGSTNFAPGPAMPSGLVAEPYSSFAMSMLLADASGQSPFGIMATDAVLDRLSMTIGRSGMDTTPDIGPNTGNVTMFVNGSAAATLSIPSAYLLQGECVSVELGAVSVAAGAGIGFNVEGFPARPEGPVDPWSLCMTLWGRMLHRR